LTVSSKTKIEKQKIQIAMRKCREQVQKATTFVSLPSLTTLSRPDHSDLDAGLAGASRAEGRFARSPTVTTLEVMRALGISASYGTSFSAAGAGCGVGELLSGLPSFRPPPETHQPQTLGKRPRKQLDPQRDPAAAGHLLCAAREEELPGATPSAGAGAAASFRYEEEVEKEEVIRQGQHRDSSSRLKGVTQDKRRNKWKAQGRAHGKQVHIGYYKIKEDAARAYHDYAEHGTLPARKVPTSAFRGVSWKKRKKAWRAEIRKSGQSTYLGFFQTQQEAALAYNAAVNLLGYPASWLNNVPHAGSAGGDEHNNKDVPAGKKAVVAVFAKPPCRRRPTSTHAGGAFKTPPPAAVRGRAAQHLTPYGLRHEANIVRNKAHMVAPEVAGLAQKAGVPPDQSLSPPPRPHPAPDAARTSTS
jgi:hypothetical protein